MHTCYFGWNYLGAGAGLQREVNKCKFLEVKDSVLVPSLCPAPDAMCNSE